MRFQKEVADKRALGANDEVVVPRLASRAIFEPKYAAKSRIFDRLKRYAKTRQKKRWMNFVSVQYVLLKYRKIALDHWALLYRH